MNRAKSICGHPNCNVLLSTPGYCPKHKKESPFKGLDRKKTPETIKFYRSNRWRKTSESFRYDHPLCFECKMNGKTTPAKLVHHTPDLKILLEKNLDPYDRKYLRSSCFNCHQKELRGKVNVSKRILSRPER